MTDFLNSEVSTVLQRLHLNQIAVLIDILRHNDLHQIYFIRNIYDERAEFFNETVIFLKAIGWIKEFSGLLELTPHAVWGPPATEIQAFMAVTQAMAACHGSLREVFAKYLTEFVVHNSEIIQHPSIQSRLERRGIRNVLIEMRIVVYEPDADRYVLDQRFAYLYFWARNVSGPRSKMELLLAASKRDKLGAAAEIAVLGYERERVGPAWRAQVEHVSADYPGACFDIKSVSLFGNLPSLRFIEVKAVPSDTYRFYWTASEIEAARLLVESYFLYLLPVQSGHEFDLSRIKTIQNPYFAIYQSQDKWHVEPEVISCYKKVDF